ncbi:KinB-signaling pathway activation protein [Bacillus sp. FJAT-18017]|uniref:KinB-signaling pathway activation protein n=1 Tax=Bacillus sp. FJAT-18017 TaxID=1705566 RepID=UPI0006AF553F|nr:KinB-signaling pathway activation protein [Bacillus sp. FJAT-18017]ALC88365.1 KinB-signaling pathway activation protein [Bacillus sp. FJAT-18017]
MTSRNWVKLFFNTLVLGALVTIIVGFIVRWNEFAPLFADFNILEILSVMLWLIGVGMIFSLLSQAGFFAYLTVHRFGLGIFRSAKLWNAVQVILLAFVLFDLIYLRYDAFAKEGESILRYVLPALVILAVGLIVAFLKMKQTNKEAFIPALFFIVVATILEWVPVLRVNEESWFFLMLFPLLACNAYQLLVLHKLNQKSQEERKRFQERKAATAQSLKTKKQKGN